MESEPGNNTPQRDPPPETGQARDRLTIRRLLLLTLGLAVGLGGYMPSGDGGILNVDGTLAIFNACLLGLALPAPLIVLGQRISRAAPVGPGGLFATTMGLGSLLMLPPALMARLAGRGGGAVLCLFYVMPLVSLWYLMAALLAGQFGRRLLARSTPWTERYGFLLAVLWAPLGAWLMLNFYLGEI